MEGLVPARRGLVLVLVMLGSAVTLVSGRTSAELPLMPPVDRAQSALAWDAAPAAQTHVHLLMIRLIRTFFGDQVKWSPFRRTELVVHTHHHRIVHEHRPRLSRLLAKRRFHLRGRPAAPASKPQQQQQ